jgi:hypothetical protein
MCHHAVSREKASFCNRYSKCIEQAMWSMNIMVFTAVDFAFASSAAFGHELNISHQIPTYAACLLARAMRGP